MIWLLPAALAGLVLLAGPTAVHLLTRRRAPRVPFPTIRFLRESRSTAVRPRRPSDLGLLLVRLGIVAAGVLAVAQPLILFPVRVAGWNARVARAVVVDTSASMRQPDASGRMPVDAARVMADGEARSAFASVRVETADLDDGLARAARQLERTAPARAEIVVLSDFQEGTLSERAIAAVPSHLGLRFVRAGTLPAARTWPAGAIDGWRNGRWQQQISIDGSSSSVSWRRIADAPAVPGVPRLPPSGGSARVTLAAASGEEQQARAALAAAASLGITSVDNHPIAVAFRGAVRPDGFGRPHLVRTRWIANAVRELRKSDLIREALDATDVAGRDQVGEPWTPIVRDARGRVVVLAAEDEGTWLIETSASASSLFAPALLRAALLARADSPATEAAEVRSISDDRLARWRRAPAAVTTEMSRRVETSDARWLWAAALALLLVESWLRRRQDRSSYEESHVRAA